ncbi:MAG: hypothetical protein AUF65_01370 [Chloroflexi bacterium 13_1_20CM_50_12]|nr:MAG: hypothetical protein AUF65_01370 [Chloroflexi bacterium 13_1_20CM_50_12]
MTALQLPEGFTVRKIGNSLKIVPMRRRKAVIVKKQMLTVVRSEYCGEFDWQESLKDTVLANKEQSFTVDEMYAALESICKDGDEQLDSKERVARRLEGLSQRACQIKLEKVAEQTYKFAYVG